MPGRFQDNQLVQPKNGRSISDQIYWFDEKVDDHCVNIRLIIKTVTFIAMRLIDIPYRLACRSKARLTSYPSDSVRYVKHVDNPNPEGRRRRVTAIYYLNPEWKPRLGTKDGGSLRLFSSNAPAGTHFDIEPLADNLVIFWFDSRNLQEVLPTFAI
uniref:Prolyl 4-hydroxylase alpha subunit Fe(2+) 2OG dioxygenase domain-containing protein n=1 Tax=Romanomermis culicivorax TaxID=13658 RepID=A0A915JRX7_ROMCU